MKIVHIMGYFVPEFGYQEYYIARKHKQIGHDVYIIASDMLYPFPNVETMLKEAGIKNTSRKRKPGFSMVDGLKVYRLKHFIEYTDFILAKGLKEALKEIKPDVVFAHESRQGLPALAARWKKQLRYKYIIDQHDFWHLVKNHGPIKKSLRYLEYEIFRKRIVNYAIKRADAIIGVTPESKQFLVQRHHIDPKKIDMIRLGVFAELFEFSNILRKKIRKKHGIKDDEVLLMFSGNIFPRKYLELLLNAFSKLNIKTKTKLLIVGTGEKNYMKKLKLLARRLKLDKAVIFAGFINRKMLRAYYSACDIAIWSNNNSISTLEAMSCKRPVILPELQLKGLAAYDNGYTFKPFDEKNLIDVMKKLVNNKKLRQKMGINGYKAVLKNYDYTKIAKDFLKVAERIKRN